MGAFRGASVSFLAIGFLVLASSAPVAAQSGDLGSRGLWPAGLVEYRFDSRVELEFRDLFRDSMREWAEETGAVSFVELPGSALGAVAWRLGFERSLLIRQDPGLRMVARTTVGWGPRRSLVFNPAKDDPAWWRADLLHELGHVLGLTHEHQRPDRDLFVTIPREFLESAGDRIGDYSVAEDWPFPEGPFPYDYDSIMHYGSNIDSNRMTRADTGGFLASSKVLSKMDIEKIRLLYSR
ncbi:MAG: M12 family metallopeptidase [Spirochaetaceae bacterium]|nr:M12 family metallopeptidase [Spirochaetaceae bacterium]